MRPQTMNRRDDGNEAERPRGQVLSLSLVRRLRERGDGDNEHFDYLRSWRLWRSAFGVGDNGRLERLVQLAYAAWRSWQRERDREAQERAERRVRRGTLSLYQEMRAYGSSAKFSIHKAEEGLEQVTTAHDFDPTQLFLKRVTACVGWAVHGLVFEYVDGTRMGYVIDTGCVKYLDLDDEHIRERRGLEWTDIHYGDYIVGIHGNRLANPNSLWLCHTVELEFASGKSIRYEAKHEPWRGEPFSYKVPQPCLVYRITFGHGQQKDMRGLITSLHLPVSAANLPLLPLKYQKAARETWQALQQVDEVVESTGQTPLGEDLWWHILGMLSSWQLPLPLPTREKGRSDEETRAGLDEGAQRRLDEELQYRLYTEFLRQDEEAAFYFLAQHRGGDDDTSDEDLFLSSLERANL